MSYDVCGECGGDGDGCCVGGMPIDACGSFTCGNIRHIGRANGAICHLLVEAKQAGCWRLYALCNQALDGCPEASARVATLLWGPRPIRLSFRVDDGSNEWEALYEFRTSAEDWARR